MDSARGLGYAAQGAGKGVRPSGVEAELQGARLPAHPSVAGPVARTHCTAGLAGLRALGTHHAIREVSVGTDSSHGAREQKFCRFVLLHYGSFHFSVFQACPCGERVSTGMKGGCR